MFTKPRFDTPNSGCRWYGWGYGSATSQSHDWQTLGSAAAAMQSRGGNIGPALWAAHRHAGGWCDCKVSDAKRVRYWLQPRDVAGISEQLMQWYLTIDTQNVSFSSFAGGMTDWTMLNVRMQL